jgi:hypothetical protein
MACNRAFQPSIELTDTRVLLVSGRCGCWGSTACLGVRRLNTIRNCPRSQALSLYRAEILRVVLHYVVLRTKYLVHSGIFTSSVR